MRAVPVTKVQMWAAVFLTSGEFVASTWLLVHEGHVLALYLAVTYAVRETSGGHHYHEIIINAIRKLTGRQTYA